MGLDGLTKFFALIATAMPLVALLPPAQKFLFGRGAGRPTPLGQATLACLGGFFGVGVFVLIITISPSLFIHTKIGREVSGNPDGNNTVGVTAYCDQGIPIGASCYGSNNSDAKLFNHNVSEDAVGCTWLGARPGFVGSVRPICVYVGLK